MANLSAGQDREVMVGFGTDIWNADQSISVFQDKRSFAWTNAALPGNKKGGRIKKKKCSEQHEYLGQFKATGVFFVLFCFLSFL